MIYPQKTSDIFWFPGQLSGCTPDLELFIFKLRTKKPKERQQAAYVRRKLKSPSDATEYTSILKVKKLAHATTMPAEGRRTLYGITFATLSAA